MQVSNKFNLCFIFQILSTRWQTNQFKMRVNFVRFLCICNFLYGPPLLEAQPTTWEEEDTCSSLQTVLLREEILLLKEQFAASLVVQKEMLRNIDKLSHNSYENAQKMNDSLMVQKEMLRNIDVLSHDSHDNAQKLNDSLVVQKKMFKNIGELSHDNHDNAQKLNDSHMVQQEMLKNIQELSHDNHDNAQKLNESLIIQKEMLKNIDELYNDSHDNAQTLNGCLRDLKMLMRKHFISHIDALPCFDKSVSHDIPYCTAGWLIIQRRMDGSVNFYRGWSDYRQGFGNPSGEFWIGLETMHSLMQNRTYKLRIDLEDFYENTGYAEYSTFAISDEAHNYTLSIGKYSGTAGDALAYSNHAPFLTKDHRGTGHSARCPVQYKGAWWYLSCAYSNLNGQYLRGAPSSLVNGVSWYQWRRSYSSLKTTIMMIKPVD